MYECSRVPGQVQDKMKSSKQTDAGIQGCRSALSNFRQESRAQTNALHSSHYCSTNVYCCEVHEYRPAHPPERGTFSTCMSSMSRTIALSASQCPNAKTKTNSNSFFLLSWIASISQRRSGCSGLFLLLDCTEICEAPRREVLTTIAAGVP